MSKPREEINNQRYIKDIHFLYEILASLKTTDELKSFLKDILTKTELKMFKRRWHAANLIYQGLDIRTVANIAQMSTQTVSKIKQVMEDGNGGYILAIKKMNEILKKESRKNKKRRGGSKFVKSWFD